MTTPKVAATEPIQIDLEPGEHYWCACGHSQSQPFCDGSHRGTGLEPLAFTIDEAQQGYLCSRAHAGENHADTVRSEIQVGSLLHLVHEAVSGA